MSAGKTPIFNMEECLEILLPSSYNYNLVKWEKENDRCFNAVLRADIHSEEEAKMWLQSYENQNKLNFRVLRTYPASDENPKIIFKRDYRCHHNTRASLPSSKTKVPSVKHLNCKAFLRITVKNSKMKKSKDELLSSHPCEITIKHDHNHLIDCADILRHRRPTPQTENKIMELFKNGHSPSSALDTIKFDLQEQYGADYFKYAADGAVCPSLQWAFHKYYSYFKVVYGEPNGTDMIKSLDTFISKYNSFCDSECAKFFFDENENEIMIAICSPLMKRVHENLKSSSEIMFVDSSGSMDRHCSRVFTFLAPSLAGALPVGILILFSESEKSVTKGLELLKEIFPKNAFFSQKYPKVIMTDDSKSERNSLHVAFPDAKLLLCKFHVLQAFWRYLQNSKNNVERHDRPVVFNLFKKLFFCENKNQCDDLVGEIVETPIIKKYSNVVTYIINMYSRADEWIPVFFSDYLTRGHNTNNLSESNFRTIKEKNMGRIKAYSVVQLFDFFITRYDSFFERKLSDYLSNRIINHNRSRYCIPESKTEHLIVNKVTEDIYTVKNNLKGTEYEVNSLLEYCSCPIGDQGAACKHQLAVALKFQLQNNQLILKHDVGMKYIMHRILGGSTENLPDGWYNRINNKEINTASTIECSLNNEPVTSQIETYDDLEQNETTIHENNQDSDATLSNVKRDLKEVFEKLQSNLEDSDVLVATQSFIENFKSLKTKSALISSLHTFGKNQIYHSRKRNYISVQPTSVARRKAYLGGRKSQHTGRPAKNCHTAEHGYVSKNKRTNYDHWLVPVKRRKAAPHSMTYCVEQNISLGK